MKTDDVRRDIPLLDEIIYLDAASTTPTPRPVVKAMCDYFYNYNVNTGRGAYRLALRATQELDNAREIIAKFVKSDPNEIIFTKNTTEAINIVAHGIEFQKGENIVVPNIEHHSNLVPWLNLQSQGVEVRIVKADDNGIVHPETVENLVDRNTRLVSITHVSNSIGSVQPVDELGKIAEDNDALYLVDAAQSAGHMKIDAGKLGADFMVFPGHKGLLGPVGTGFLYCAHDSHGKLEPLNLGGGTVEDVTEEDFKLIEAPSCFEGGTQNIAGFIGLGAAITYLEKIGMSEVEKHTRKLTKVMYNEIREIETVRIYGSPENIYGIVSFNIDNINPHDLAKILDELKSICVRSGYHCAIPSIKHVGAYQLGGTVRASIHYYNTREEIKELGETLKQISEFMA
ncbi:aminotransferase class V-fold PLP-dependent enzyme [Methanobacterium petrolearium]|uniref:aminotransferase class V-fold PLP-dependent enzyme n=1 Tax=Methanobacterium petrolearium TaxID=710190 RepID=UPI001AE80A43|nr:cysteine desulfurase [Methanobacterium petrolearium]MBP1944741.1 cysteine desulfurase/selenocysteine lyase [Methanobacterium petrolearium]BDZ70010.1 cysteine desulfurase [Methanobacterium petrolearium]